MLVMRGAFSARAVEATMRRRDVLTLFGCVPIAWPLAAGAEQSERMRRVGILYGTSADDEESQARNAAFLKALQDRGWTNGRNVQIETRWAAGDPDRISKFAAEFAALAPDVVFATGTGTVAALLHATRTVPIVFCSVPDPVGAGFVDSLAKPGGNATGLMVYDYSLGGKWLDLLKRIAPATTRAAVLRDPAVTSGIGQWAAVQTAALSLGVELTPVNVVDMGEIERSIAAFARAPNGGMIVTGSLLTAIHRKPIVALAAQYKLPAVYFARYVVKDGGLLSYGPDFVDQYRQAAGYVDRILRGAKPGELPVQAPSKYELAINAKTAKALGLEVPPTLLATADDVIE
jgi:putative tryptophan/tyrosine transport system substrate-binding protein